MYPFISTLNIFSVMFLCSVYVHVCVCVQMNLAWFPSVFALFIFLFTYLALKFHLSILTTYRFLCLRSDKRSQLERHVQREPKTEGTQISASNNIC